MSGIRGATDMESLTIYGLVIALAFMESLTIYGLSIAVVLLFANCSTFAAVRFPFFFLYFKD